MEVAAAVKHSLYRYFDETRWAEAFLSGDILFRSLSYYRDYEDEEIRRDVYEGNAIFRPEPGLLIHKESQAHSILVPDSSFESIVKGDEIFVLCFTRGQTEERRGKFGGACVQIVRFPKLCARIQAALPTSADFYARRVTYYDPAEGGSPRWALPDLIATSKIAKYRWQDEFRILFSLTDSLGFEKAQYQIVTGVPKSPPPRNTPYPEHRMRTRDLHDICRLL